MPQAKNDEKNGKVKSNIGVTLVEDLQLYRLIIKNEEKVLVFRGEGTSQRSTRGVQSIVSEIIQ